MTSIGSTSYDYSSSPYSSAAKSNAANAEPASTETTTQPSYVTLSFQGKLVTLERVGLGSDLKPINIAELPEAEYNSFMEGEQRRIEANQWFLQGQYSNRDAPPTSSSPGRPALKIDYDAMKNDPMYVLNQRFAENYAKIEQQRAAYLAKQQSGVDLSA